jgi:mRNA interferase RelE/StbE
MIWSKALTWTIEFDDKARKELRKLDKPIQKEILKYLREKIATTESPKRYGKALSSNLAGLWRYRVRDYRIICNIEDDRLTVLVVRLAHRKQVYD